MIAREIASLVHTEPIDLVALTEVEGASVLNNLTLATPLKEVNYRHVHTIGADPRGINAALFYREGSFRLLAMREIDWSERAGTLHASGIARSGPLPFRV